MWARKVKILIVPSGCHSALLPYCRAHNSFDVCQGWVYELGWNPDNASFVRCNSKKNEKEEEAQKENQVGGHTKDVPASKIGKLLFRQLDFPHNDLL